MSTDNRGRIILINGTSRSDKTTIVRAHQAELPDLWLDVTEPGNAPSQRVAERSEFKKVEVLRDHAAIDGRSIDQVAFELPLEDVGPRR